MKIVLITGVQAAGKTTFARLSASAGTKSLAPSQLAEKGQPKYFNEGRPDLIIDMVNTLPEVDTVVDWVLANVSRFEDLYITAYLPSFGNRIAKRLQYELSRPVFRVHVAPWEY